MGTLDEMKAMMGPDLGRTEIDRPDRIRLVLVCLCGHLQTAHGEGIGGTYVIPEVEETTIGGKPVRIVRSLSGCVGAMPGRYFEQTTDEFENGVIKRQHNATCPCDSFRPIAQVDRPSRSFNQKLPSSANRGDFTKHPFLLGMRAMHTRLTKFKRAVANPTWADGEFDRRFTWLPARRCSMTRCSATADVWPVFVTATDDRSELRCAKHR